MAQIDHYAVLKLPMTATYDELKRAYYELSRKVHPDKKGATVQDGCASLDANTTEFHQLSAAWEVLGDAARRKEYDRALLATQSRNRGVVQDEVDLDDMTYDEEAGIYSDICRCGGSYTIAESDMELGRNIAPCSNCSLKIRVLFEVAENDHAL